MFSRYHQIICVLFIFIVFSKRSSLQHVNSNSTNDSNISAINRHKLNETQILKMYNEFKEKLIKMGLKLEVNSTEPPSNSTTPSIEPSKRPHSTTPSYLFEKLFGLGASNIMNILDPLDLMPLPDNYVKVLLELTSSLYHLMPDSLQSLRDGQNLQQITERFLTKDLPHISNQIPKTIEGLIHEIDSMRNNGTEAVRNSTENMVNSLSKSIFIWLILSIQSRLMSWISSGLMLKAIIKMFKATPLAIEMIKLQTTLNSVNLLLSESFSAAINTMNSQINGSNDTIVSYDLQRLTKLIVETNQMMGKLQNQTHSFAELVDQTPNVIKLSDKQILAQFRGSIDSLPDILKSLSKNVKSIISLTYDMRENLLKNIEKLIEKVNTIGVVWKAPENAVLMKKLIKQSLISEDLIKIFISSQELESESINLLMTLRPILDSLKGGSLSSITNLIRTIDSAINNLKIANEFMPLSYALSWF